MDQNEDAVQFIVYIYIGRDDAGYLLKTRMKSFMQHSNRV